MIENFDTIKKQLSDLAGVINAFKSEAVQLRIIELILGPKSEPEEGAPPEDKRTPRKTTLRRRKPKVDTESGVTKKRKASGGTGANATLAQLAVGNFFDKGRTINDIIEHCKHNLACTFRANEFSGKLGRMVRTGELSRKKNADKQYEYKKP